MLSGLQKRYVKNVFLMSFLSFRSVEVTGLGKISGLDFRQEYAYTGKLCHRGKQWQLP